MRVAGRRKTSAVERGRDGGGRQTLVRRRAGRCAAFSSEVFGRHLGCLFLFSTIAAAIWLGSGTGGWRETQAYYRGRLRQARRHAWRLIGYAALQNLLLPCTTCRLLPLPPAFLRSPSLLLRRASVPGGARRRRVPTSTLPDRVL